MVSEVEWVYGIVAECVYAEGTVREELYLRYIFVEVKGHRDGCQLRPIDCVSLQLGYDLNMCGHLSVRAHDGCP